MTITNARDLEQFIKTGDYRTIYFDLDGVVANFNLSYFERTGLRAEDNPEAVWDTFIPWVDRGFFCTLLPIRPTVSLALKLKREGYGTRTLTVCGPYNSRTFKDIKAQKKYWTKKYLPEIPQRFVESGEDKKYYGRDPKVLLIDDQEKNVVSFQKYGGSAVHYVPDYDYPEENPIAKEENILGVVSDWKDKQWMDYIMDERTW